MSTREDPAHRGRRRAARIGAEVGTALRHARRSSGLSQAVVARRMGVSQATFSRMERGAGSLTVTNLAVAAAIVGLDLVVQLFPGGAPVRDVAHVRLLQRLQKVIGQPAGTTWRTEVPMPAPGDLRAIDAAIRVNGSLVGIELETRLTDAQATTRRVSLKQRDAGIDRMILVLADTRANRTALAVAAPTLRATFPLESRAVLAALRAGDAPAANGIVVV